MASQQSFSSFNSDVPSRELSKVLKPHEWKLHGSAPEPPPELKYDGTSRFIIWELENTIIFKQWWEQTPFGIQCAENPKLYPNPRWGGEGRRKRDASGASTWDHYHEVATVDKGEPWVLCRACNRKFEHPMINGNSHIKRHLETSRCIVRAKASDSNYQPPVSAWVKSNVSKL